MSNQPDHPSKTFGDTITTLIGERHLTMREVAKAAGVSLDTIRRIRAMRLPSECRPTTFRALATALSLSVDELHRLTKTADVGDLAAA